jgi:hypothetical protein
LKDTLCLFFEYLCPAKSLSDVHKMLYDVLQDDADIHGQWNVCISPKTFAGKQYYFITPLSSQSSKEAQYQLLLSSAASVLEIVHHQWCPDPGQIAHELVIRDIPFNTCIFGPCTMPVQYSIQPCYGGLGYHSQGYRPDYIDYQAYKSHHH